jgi:hypothetical protein
MNLYSVYRKIKDENERVSLLVFFNFYDIILLILDGQY